MCTENVERVKQENLSVKDCFEQYWRYCSALRNWFVAYGIGGCVLFISDKAKIFQELSVKTKAIVVIAFLSGVVVQIILAGLNKWIHWYMYWGRENKDFSITRRYKFSEKLSSCFMVDLVIDFITFSAFTIATVTLIKALFN